MVHNENASVRVASRIAETLSFPRLVDELESGVETGEATLDTSWFLSEKMDPVFRVDKASFFFRLSNTEKPEVPEAVF